MPVKNPVAKDGEALAVCTKCGRKLTKTSINISTYISKSQWNSFSGRTSICKQCMLKHVVRNKRIDIPRLIELMKHIDRPYHPTVFNASVDEVVRAKKAKATTKDWVPEAVIAELGEDVFGRYMRAIAKQQHRDETFADSTHSKEDEIDTSRMPVELNDVKLGDLISKFGFGYEDIEYYAFEQKYQKLLLGYNVKTALHEEGLVKYVRFAVREELATARGDVGEATKWAGLASNAATAAKINVAQMSKSDTTGGVDAIGLLFEALEDKAGVIDLCPDLLMEPADEADMVIWSVINYGRRLQDLPTVPYKDIYQHYDEMLEEFYEVKGWNETEKQDFRDERSRLYRDLSKVYPEPTYDDEDWATEEGDED